MTAEFVRWECGCVGLIFPQWGSETHPSSYIIDACDSDDGAAGLWLRDMDGKTSTPLTYNEVERMFLRINRELGDGLMWRRFKALIKD